METIIEKIQQSEINKRWQKYREGISKNNDVRFSDLNLMLETIDPRVGEKILEVGTGNGYLTFPLSRKLGDSGLLITADINSEGLEHIINTKKDLPILTQQFSDDYLEEEKFSYQYNGFFDKVVSLATFHHFDNRGLNTGDYDRMNFLKEAFNLLKPNGKLVISDVVDGSLSQKYFDLIDNPIHFSPCGHPHNFYSLDEFRYKLENIGYKNISMKNVTTPWKFKSKEHAGQFFNTIHNAKCSIDESFNVLMDIFEYKKVGDYYEVNWEMGYIEAYK